MRHIILGLVFLLVACSDDADRRSLVAPPDAGVDVAPPHCDDRVKNGDETDIDCGGACGASCVKHATCEWDEDCMPGLYCEDNGSPADNRRYSCVERVASCAGQPCAADEFCIHYASISDDDMDINRYYCTRRNPLGSSCGRHYDKDVNSCVEGAACIDEACAPSRPVGDACEYNSDCGRGLWCDFESERCRPQFAEGESCLNSEECAPGLHCDRVSRRCEPRAAPGGDCFQRVFECDVGLECAFPPDLVCEHWIECMASRTACCATSDGGAQCVPDTPPDACEPPKGVCDIETLADEDIIFGLR
jgi:hypothetical protein